MGNSLNDSVEYWRKVYTDTHVWKFTPSIFKEIIETLSEIKLIDLKIERIYPTLINTLEFHCILSKNI